MRILYVDIDSLRADHLGCYGYHRRTSPNIDALAAEGVRFDRLYGSDSPCLPSRSALIFGRFGINNGVVTHGGTAADPFPEGPPRHFQSRSARTTWTRRMRTAGVRSTTISTFGERHSASQWYQGFNEVYNLGTMGFERADQVDEVAQDWLRRNGASDDWFLHVNLWDPHTPYRTPDEYGDPFADEPLPSWLTEDVRAQLWERPGPHSAQEMLGFTPLGALGRPIELRRQPSQLSDSDEVRRMFDGYDTGVHYSDHYVGRLINTLADMGLLEETAVIVSADHGEALGELGVCGDHHTADETVNRLPMIIRWPGIEGGRVDEGFRYQIDMAATVLEMLGAKVPDDWDAVSFADGLRSGAPDEGRGHVVVGHGAWTCQRAVRFERYLCIRTYHDGYHGYPDVMLFDIEADPHEQQDLADKEPAIVDHALRLLEEWHVEAMRRSSTGIDPMWTVLREGGPWHTRGHLRDYLTRLRDTGRGSWADDLEAKHGAERELQPPQWGAD